MNIKLERINSSIQREISYIISNEVKNPDIKFITITDVDTTNDLSFCKIYFTTLDDRKEVLNGLNSAKGFIRRELADRIDLRHVPELEFLYDESIEYSKNIEEKIKEIHETNKK